MMMMLIKHNDIFSYLSLDNPKYDSLEGTNDWAKISLQLHEADVRPVLYTRIQLEEGKTHDDLWNAAQIQMTRDGKMHVRSHIVLSNLFECLFYVQAVLTTSNVCALSFCFIRIIFLFLLFSPNIHP